MERDRQHTHGSGTVTSIAPARNKRSERVEFLPNVDGRTLLARRWQQHASDIISDQGGSDMSTARLFLCKRLAAISAMLEDIEAAHLRNEPIDINAYLSMVQTAVRLSNTLGLNRRTKKVPDLQDWIASHSNEHAEDEDEAQPRSRRVIRSRTIEHDEDDD